MDGHDVMYVTRETRDVSQQRSTFALDQYFFSSEAYTPSAIKATADSQGATHKA